MKKALGLMVAFGAMSLMSVSAYAATYTVDSTTAKAGDTVEVTISATADSDSNAVNGYALNIGYDADVLTPVVAKATDGTDATDATGSPLYATNELGDGVIVASPTTVDGSSVLAVAWADSEAESLSTDSATKLATITFQVKEDTDKSSTDLSVVVKADAVSADDLDTTHDEVAAGVITLGGLLGDVNADGSVDVDDITLVTQYVNKVLTSLEDVASGAETRANVNNDDAIDVDDITLITQYVNKVISSFE